MEHLLREREGMAIARAQWLIESGPLMPNTEGEMSCDPWLLERQQLLFESVRRQFTGASCAAAAASSHSAFVDAEGQLRCAAAS